MQGEYQDYPTTNTPSAMKSKDSEAALILKGLSDKDAQYGELLSRLRQVIEKFRPMPESNEKSAPMASMPEMSGILGGFESGRVSIGNKNNLLNQMVSHLEDVIGI